MSVLDRLRRLSSRPPGEIVSRIVTAVRRAVSNAMPVGPTGTFGVREALLYGGGVDTWERYVLVLRAIHASCDVTKPLTVLEVGAGADGLLRWRRTERWLDGIVSVDLNRAALGENRRSAVATGAALPFRDRAFDLAVCVDSLEHVPPSDRRRYARELTRVADVVVAHFPAQTADGAFAGRTADRAFQDWHVATHGIEEWNTAEHLAVDSHPDPFELFPDGAVTGTQPVSRWLEFMRAGYRRWEKHTAGFAYRNRRRKGLPPDAPPFHGALVVWRRATG